MIQTEYTVLTPVGKFVAQWDENPEKHVTYAGNASAVDFFRDFLNVARVTGDDGIQIDPDNLEPSDLVGFCQSEEYGILVMPDSEDSFLDASTDQAEAALDSVRPVDLASLQAASSPMEKVAAASLAAKSVALGNGHQAVRTISAQRFIDDEIVAKKVEAEDFDVFVSPAFDVDGWGRVRVVTDGHHSLAAAKLARVDPVWHEQDARDNDTVALLSRGDQGIDDFLSMHRIDSD